MGKRMIIGIDASKTTLEQKTGIDNTAYQIILNLKKLDKKNIYNLYTNKPLSEDLKGGNFYEKLIPFPRLWNKFRLPLALYKDRPDRYLALTNTVPSFAPENSAILVHDLAFKFFPEAYSKTELLAQELAIKAAITRAKRIIFTSEANKKDFLKYYDYPASQIKIVPLSYNNSVYKQIQKPKNVLSLKEPFFLFVGRLETRKNIHSILEAFKKFKESCKTNHKLVLVGKTGHGGENVAEIINSSPILKNDVVLAGYRSDEDVANLYNLADAFIFPSLYEGFGLPILEAFACGAPVLTSDIATLREVAKDAALYVDPLDIDSIAEGMSTISANQTLRKRNVKAGFERVKDFAWNRTAAAILEIIEQMK